MTCFDPFQQFFVYIFKGISLWYVETKMKRGEISCGMLQFSGRDLCFFDCFVNVWDLCMCFVYVFSYYFLGERRWKYILIFSFPFVAIFMYLLHGVLAVYLRDPLLKYLGIMG